MRVYHFLNRSWIDKYQLMATGGALVFGVLLALLLKSVFLIPVTPLVIFAITFAVKHQTFNGREDWPFLFYRLLKSRRGVYNLNDYDRRRS